MSNINDKATVSLFVNGEQAEDAMDRLRKKAQDLDKRLQTAMAAGDRKSANKLQRELDRVTKELNRTESAAKGAGIVLNNLGNSSIHGLRNALKYLEKELRMTKPNSDQWHKYADKIELVKGRIAELNHEMDGGQSLWARFKKWADDTWPAIDLLSRGYDSAVSFMRSYVEAFAAMDQEMANVRKFTGMTEEQVASLNEEFKNMDTRTSREGLNQLAQEAGRLGKTSEEDVLGFVRAADKINVALDDLGDGATLTLSKLTGIFGDEERYGTEQALLKVGSVINDLSQNCSASAPYLANFAERLGGVGSQAGLTISQIMGFGAVLDSNAQAVEASATALSQIIVRLYQDPAKYARVAGLEVENFSRLMREDANAALILFLESLQQAGGMDVLSPMFKDMGENGSRAIAALSTLATHIDQVKAQQEAANVAFAKGTSVDKEYAVQNETVQASLEKAQKRFQELRVELGEKLSPLMAHIISSTSAMANAISVVVDFCIQLKSAIIVLTTAIGSYYVAVGVATIAQKAWDAAVLLGKNVFTAFTYTIGLCQVGMIALTHGTKAAGTAFTFLNQTMKANPFGLVISLLATLSFVIYKVVSATDKYTKDMTEAMKAANVFSEASQKEQLELDKLVGRLEGAQKGSKAYEDAKQAIIKQYGQYLQGLINERGEITNLEEAYNRLTYAIRQNAKIRGIENSRQAVTDTYTQGMVEQVQNLRDSLADFGADTRTIERIVGAVEEQISTGRAIPTEIQNELAAIQNQFDFSHLFDRDNTPMAVFNRISQRMNDYQARMRTLDDMEAGVNPARNAPDAVLASAINGLERAIEEINTSGYPGDIVPVISESGAVDSKYMTKEEIEDLLRRYRWEQGNRTVPSPPNGDRTVGSITTPGSTPTKEKKLPELEAKRELAKASAEFERLLEKAKGDYEAGSARNIMDYGTGLKSYEDYITEKERLDLAYLDARIALYNSLYEDESEQEKNLLLMYDEDYQELLLKRAEITNKQRSDEAKHDVEEYTRQYKMALAEKEFEFTSPYSKIYDDSQAQEEELHRLRIDYLMKCRDAYDKSTREYADYQRQVESAEQDHMLDRRKNLMQKYEQWVNQYTSISADRRYEIEKGLVEELYKARKISEEEYQLWLAQLREKHNSETAEASSAASKSKYTVKGFGDDIDIRSDEDQIQARVDALKRVRDKAVNELKQRFNSGLIDENEYKSGLKAIGEAYETELFSKVREGLDEQTRMLLDMGVLWYDFFKGISTTGKFEFDDLTKVAAASLAVMTAGLQTYAQFVEAEKRIELNAVEKRYDREVKMAQGNSYKVAKAEKKKEDEIAKVKAEYAKKEFAIKVIMAVAQTAQNALLGYAAGLQAGFPMAAWLAPLLAGLAAAQGAIQIALIKKQQQAAAAEGYSKGGFTKPGAVNEPAGIVHAGEWVASQKLLSSPVARPMIEALDYAQRTNTIGSLRAEDVSRSITASNSLVRIAESDNGALAMAAVASQMSTAVARLTDRLNRPFVTVNTVTGDKGIKQAQDEYTRLMNNITPKSKRK